MNKDIESENDDTLSLTIVVLTSIFSLLFIFYIVIYTKHKNLEKEIRIKTNGVKVKDFSKITPIIGELSMGLDPLVYQRENHPKYGNIFATLFLNEPMIVCSGTELLEQIYYENAKNIKHEWTDQFIQMFGKNNLSNVVGETHKRYKKVVIGSVGAQNLARLFPGFVKIFDKCIKNWIERTKDGSYIDVVPEVQRAVWDAVSLVVFGDDLSQELSTEIMGVMDIFGRGLFALPINLPFTELGKSLAARRRFHEILCLEYKNRQSMPNNGTDRQDLFQQIINSTCDEEFKEGFNVDFAIGVVWASLDTTKSTTLHMIDTMIDHAKEWEIIRNDVKNAFGAEGILAPEATYSTLLKEVPYLSACVEEITRINGVGVLQMRKIINDFELRINGKTYIAPAGYKLYTSSYYTGIDPESKIYSDPTTFKPERFLGDNAEDKVSGYKCSSVAFGVGERSCPGKMLAKLEMEIFMALMSNYKWTRRERPKKWTTAPLPIPDEGLWIRGAPFDKSN